MVPDEIYELKLSRYSRTKWESKEAKTLQEDEYEGAGSIGSIFWEFIRIPWEFWESQLLFSSIEADTCRVEGKLGKDSLPPTPSSNWEHAF